MSLDIKGQKCAVCQAYLFEDDDVVNCAVCGAPHHRDCYNSLGHCGLEAYHGTEKQYKVPSFEEKNEKKEEKTQEKNDFFGQIPYANFVEIKDNTIIEDGVTAVDAAKVVMVNPFRYIPKFLKLSDKKASWNWAAFLFPHCWFAYRKMYKQAVIAGLFMVIATLLMVPFNIAINQLPVPPEEAVQGMSLLNFYSQSIDEIETLPLAMAFFGALVQIAVSVISGIFADRIYRGHVVEIVRELKTSDDIMNDTRKKGGVNLLAFAIAYFVMNLLSNIMMTFFL